MGCADGVAAGHTWTTVAGVALALAVTCLCYRGIRVSARVQYALFGIEAAILVIFSVVALVKVYIGHAPAGHLHPALAWFSPFGSGGTQAFTAGLLLALFIYWG